MCKHNGDYIVECRVHYLVDSNYMLDLAVNCKGCGMPFRFKGLPVGLNMEGAAVDPMGLELRIKIVPADQEEAPVMKELEARDGRLDS